MIYVSLNQHKNSKLLDTLIRNTVLHGSKLIERLSISTYIGRAQQRIELLVFKRSDVSNRSQPIIIAFSFRWACKMNELLHTCFNLGLTNREF